MAAVLAATVTLIPAAPASAAAPKVAKESPTLPSAPLVKVQPELGKGDFNDPPPHPADMDKVRPVPKESYERGPLDGHRLRDHADPQDGVER